MWFDAKKKYGFIARDDGGGRIFVHQTTVEQAGRVKLEENERVSFDLGIDTLTGRTIAVNLVITG
ncbi:MAG: cold shock domain-containing protein [Rhizobiales bacterium]|nr:cold shock domain-containing protein [Hyphomicrobiales bacterium]